MLKSTVVENHHHQGVTQCKWHDPIYVRQERRVLEGDPPTGNTVTLSEGSGQEERVGEDRSCLVL